VVLDDLSFADKKMIEAFGRQLLNSVGTQSHDIWDDIWKRVIRLRGKQYRLPGGALGKRFTSKYAEEITALANGKSKSEVSACFIPLMLQKDKTSPKQKISED
jgi:hypothetical protein